MTKDKKRTFEMEAVEPNNFRININLKDNQTQRFLLRSDAHWDNPHSLNDLEEKHLKEAVAQNAIILDFGDLFCAMEGKGDRRGAKNLRPEHVSGNYLDKLVSTAADRYAPYAANWAMMGRGNHEESINIHHETDLTQRLTERLTDRTGHRVFPGGMWNWITIVVKEVNDKGVARTYNIWAHHGYGGGGPVTLNSIQGQRVAAYVEGADMYIMGHVHESWMMERMKLTRNSYGKLVTKEVMNVQIPTYKEEFLGNGGRGFHASKGRGPKPIGAWWLDLTLVRETVNGQRSRRLVATVTRAK